MNKQEFLKIMLILGEVFNNGKPLSLELLDIYFEIFSKYSIDEFKKGANKIIASRITNSFPKPAEILKEIEGSQDDKSLTAWLKVKEAIARVGAYQSVQFDDPVIHTVINELGGWPKVCKVLEDNLTWMQKDFERIYKLCARQSDHPQKAIGISETVNNSNGISLKQKPIEIGNVNKIKQLERKNAVQHLS